MENDTPHESADRKLARTCHAAYTAAIRMHDRTVHTPTFEELPSGVRNAWESAAVAVRVEAAKAKPS